MFTERIWKDCVTAPVPSLHCADQLLGVVCSWSISSIGWRAPCSRINFDIFPYTITCQAQAHSILDKDECSKKARIATRNSWLCSSGFNNASALLINLLRATPSLDPDLVESEQAEHPNQTLHPSIGVFRRTLDRWGVSETFLTDVSQSPDESLISNWLLSGTKDLYKYW